MAKKFKFRKMYFLCRDNIVIKPEIDFTNAYQRKEYAMSVLASQDTSIKMWEKDTKPKKYSIEGFYLIHESFFDEENK